MTGQQGDIVAQRPDTLTDGIEQRLMVAAREIRSSDRAPEDHVADDRDASARVVEDHVAGRVSRTMVHPQLLLADADFVALVQPAVRSDDFAGWKAELLAPLRQAVEQETVIAVWSLDRQVLFPGHARGGTGMVEMTVRQEDLLQLHAGLFGLGKDALGLAAGIDHGGLAGVLAAQQGAVLLEGGNGNDTNLHKEAGYIGRQLLSKAQFRARAGRRRTCGKAGKMLMGWAKKKRETTVDLAGELAQLGPLEGKSADVLKSVLAVSDVRDVEPGALPGGFTDHDQIFLRSGEIAITTASGRAVALKADAYGARFPLPPGRIASRIEARTPCRLLRVRGGAIPQSLAATPQAPRLNTAEADAVNGLRDYMSAGNHELPSLPDLAMKIGTAIDKSTTASADIARLIQLDPVLSSRILSVVNSAAFGGVRRVTSIQQATTRLGRNNIRSLVFSTLLKGIFKVDSPILKKRMRHLWQQSAHVAALSFVLGRVTPGIDPEQALLAGLIHDIGSIAVIGGIIQFPLIAERDEVYRHVLDSLSGSAGLQTVNHWRLHKEFGEVVSDGSNWWRTGSAIPDLVDVVLLARLHAAVGLQTQAGLPRIDEVPAFGKLADGQLTPQRSLAVLANAAADVREIQSLIEH